VLADLLAAAFIEIRATAYADAHIVEIEGLAGTERIRFVADLFHTVPGLMDRAANGDGTYQAILDELWTWNVPFGQPWLAGLTDYAGMDRSSSTFDSWKWRSKGEPLRIRAICPSSPEGGQLLEASSVPNLCCAACRVVPNANPIEAQEWPAFRALATCRRSINSATFTSLFALITRLISLSHSANRSLIVSILS